MARDAVGSLVRVGTGAASYRVYAHAFSPHFACSSIWTRVPSLDVWRNRGWDAVGKMLKLPDATPIPFEAYELLAAGSQQLELSSKPRNVWSRAVQNLAIDRELSASRVIPGPRQVCEPTAAAYMLSLELEANGHAVQCT
jgi:hypothetical protein